MESLDRYLDAQDKSYEQALEEIKKRRKRSHWMWYIFPQIKGLGQSPTSIYYSIQNLEEANEYLKNPILGTRLKEITNELLNLELNDPVQIFGGIDSLKLKSCMTLFDYISDDDIFKKVLDKYYDGKLDELTLNICNSLSKELKR